MTKNETLHIRVNGSVKANAEKTLDALGLSISEAVNILLHQIPLVGGLPFDVRKPPAPESVIVRSMEELYAKLEEAEEDIAAGRVISADDMWKGLEEKYEFLR
jgi:DNA-damage-inducible protein J